ncbi:MAG: 50S ribosomal protein L18 [Nanoarchaeota archaeon]|nr:50S ribosomal protein L18 [Nanoarchaeota archaeon]
MTKVLRRRRFEAKTDYRSRLDLLKSSFPRLIIRKTNRQIIVQIIESKDAQDKVLFSAASKDLLTQGWPKDLAGSLKSKPAAYLTGYLLAKRAVGKTKKAILDTGLNRNVKKSRLYSALKGVIDGGIEIPHKEDVLPSDEELSSNVKVGSLINKLKAKI